MTVSFGFVEATTAIRDHLRTVLDVTVYAAGLPTTPTLPAVVITRVGGAPDGPIDAGLYQLDCWAATAPAAAATASTVAEWVLSHGPVALDGLDLVGGLVVSLVFLDDPNPNLYRYTLTATIHTRAHHP